MNRIVQLLGQVRSTTRLIIGFSFLLGCFGVAMLISITSFNSVNRLLNDLYERPFAFSTAIQKVDGNIYKIQYLLAQSSYAEGEALEALVSQIEAGRANIEAGFKTASETYPGDSKELQAGLDRYRAWVPIQDQIIAYARKGNIMDADDLQANEGLKHVSALGKQMQSYIDAADAYAADFVAKANGNKTRLIRVLAGIVGVSLLLFVAVAVLMSKSILVPVNKTVTFADRMKTGDFTGRLGFSLKDEFGDLAGALDAMSDSLSKMIGSVVETTTSLSASSKGLSDISRNMADNTRQTSNKADTVTRSVTDMQQHVRGVAASMEKAIANTQSINQATEEMSATINEIAKNSERARGISSNAVDITQQTSDQMNLLDTVAKDIDAVTETIAEISDQTNLLALNATIEAARAGDAGKGFGVVANEIKELAGQTAQATQDIKAKIESVQKTTALTVHNMKDVVAVISDVNDIIATIASAVEEQSVSTQEIAGNLANTNSALEGVNDAVAHTSELIHAVVQDMDDVNQASTSISTSSAQVDENATNLEQMAAHLKQELARFKV